MPTGLTRALAIVLLAGCSAPPSARSPAVVPQTIVTDSDALAAVAFVHGGAGPWAVAGYRMGEAALARLGLPRQSFDLEVIHHTPQKVQFSCIADGAAAATGASVGKLNLKLVDAADADVVTTYVNRKTGQRVSLRPTASFAARFTNVPRERLGDTGREVVALPDAAIFEEVGAVP